MLILPRMVDNAHAIAARQGTVSFNQGEIHTTGPDAAIAKIYNGGKVTLKNTSAVAHQGLELCWSLP